MTAARFGIAANIEFPLPASFIWDMFVRVLKIFLAKAPSANARA
ncbi:exodeoxyribonuclease V subunit gamma [Klebsiella pneumoniae]|nr:exodeoxyribonuclease V subunit gamma [Klebsiella pneumoniae]